MKMVLTILAILHITTAAYAQTYTVKRVIDGDTFEAKIGDKIEIIQLIGIEVPENEENDKARQRADQTGNDLKTIVNLGKKVSDAVALFILEPEIEIYLEFDIQRYDKDGRTLAYVYRKRPFDKSDFESRGCFSSTIIDGQEYLFLNAFLICEGMAEPIPSPPNTKYANLFQKLYKEAKERNIGLWKNEVKRKDILRAATAKANELGYDLEDMDIVYDEQNRKIKEHLLHERVYVYNEEADKWDPEESSTPEKEYPALKGKNYQAVYFGPKFDPEKIQLGGDLWVFVDGDTGEVISFIRGK